MSQPAPDWVAYHATRSPHSLALESVDTGATLTWAALEQEVARVAGYLSSVGISPGDRIVLLAENDLRIFVLQFACMRLGAVLVPLNWRLAPSELEALCADAEPRAGRARRCVGGDRPTAGRSHRRGVDGVAGPRRCA